jgi:hypothetical protein
MKRIFHLSLFFLWMTTASLAAERPIWVEATGEAVQGETDTLLEVRERAKVDAQRKAVEQAVGTFIKAHTLVFNSQLAEDLIFASVRGKIEKTEILKQGWDEKDRNVYRVHIKALVLPIYPEKGQGLSLKLHLSKTNLQEGEEVKIYYQAESDCHIYLFSVAADGSVTVLLPNSQLKDHFLRAGQVYEFPPPGGNIRLRAYFLPGYQGSSAEEKIKAIATRDKKEILSLGFQQGLFKVYDGKETGMVSDLLRRLNQMDPADWAEATAVYQIRK